MLNLIKAVEELDVMADALGFAKTEGSFQLSVRAAVRGYWNGGFTRFQFFETLELAITRGYTQAWHAGAKECGLAPDELSNDELNALQDHINEQFQYIPGFADAVEEGSKANGGKLQPLFDRSELWVIRYRQIGSEARAMACADKKLEWRLGATEKHCRSCLALNGQVRRGSYWTDSGILPRVPGASYLDCGGWRCDCDLVPTDKPMSRGRLPRL